MAKSKNINEDEWKKNLTPEQYRILRQQGTEAPFSGKYVANHNEGTYCCAACGNELFSSQAKFDSKTGWPSFWDIIEEGKVKIKSDKSHGLNRLEAVCARCGGHLGHVFDDGPNPTGKRYCINSLALDFKKNKQFIQN